MPTLLHITLNLPRELNVVTNVQVKAEVHKLANLGIVERVKAFDDHDGSRFDGLGSVKGAIDVVVDGLGDGLAIFEVFEHGIHGLEVVLNGVEGCELGDFTAFTVVGVEIIKADNGGLKKK